MVYALDPNNSVIKYKEFVVYLIALLWFLYPAENFGYMLTVTTFWANAADNRPVVFFSFAQKLGFDVSCRFSQGDNLHEMLSEPVFLEN